MALLNLAGKRPDDLGPQADGRLRPCDSAANCVCSQHGLDGRDPGPSHIQAFRYAGRGADAMTRLLAVLLQQPRCTLVTNSSNYIHAEFSSATLGFVDDVEFLLSESESVIHLRSASRRSLSDFGLNRARLEDLREAFDTFDE